MTVQQADDINSLFVTYSDSIKSLNQKIWRLGYDVRFAEKQTQLVKDTLNQTKSILFQRDTLIINYKKEIARVEKLEWIDKKTRVKVTVGIASVLLAWATLFIFSK
jgi:dTDP-4-amino-4,6-dideoxygalactose transaminase